MATEQVGILVIGAGPTGLGAATRLQQHGATDWLLVDEASEAGGLACTDVTAEGFHFDMGGHVMFSHWDYFDQLLDAALGHGPGAWNTHQRVSYVRIKGRWVPYPFQNNISALDKDDQVACLTGLVEAKVAAATARSPPATFDEWIIRCMGSGIANLFMRPYNFKVWAVPPSEMQCGWLGERVATVDVSRAIANVVHGREDAGWGPNATFRFPKRGGTGAVWRGVSRLLPRDKQRYRSRVVGLDAAAKQVTLASGDVIWYSKLLSTVPLDVLLHWVGRPELGEGLHHSSTHVIGVGVRGKCPHGSKCWLYFPEDDCPFYRATVFSNYAEANCPGADARLPTRCLGDGRPSTGTAAACAAAAAARDGSSSSSHAGGGHGAAAAAAPAGGGESSGAAAEGGPYWSLMFEVSESSSKPVDSAPVELGGGSWPSVVRDTLEGAVAAGLLQPDDQVVSLYHRRLEYGYPTPSLGRDAALARALPWLQQQGIWSRGRFGSYKYEVANQDHSLMLGVEAADSMLFGTPEVTLHHPSVANAGCDTQMRYSPPEGCGCGGVAAGGVGAGGGGTGQGAARRTPTQAARPHCRTPG